MKGVKEMGGEIVWFIAGFIIGIIFMMALSGSSAGKK